MRIAKSTDEISALSGKISPRRVLGTRTLSSTMLAAAPEHPHYRIEDKLGEQFKYFRSEFIEAATLAGVTVPLDILEDTTHRVFAFIKFSGPKYILQMLSANLESVHLIRSSLSLLIVTVTILSRKLLQDNDKSSSGGTNWSEAALGAWACESLRQINEAGAISVAINIMIRTNISSVQELALSLIAALVMVSDDAAMLMFHPPNSPNTADVKPFRHRQRKIMVEPPMESEIAPSSKYLNLHRLQGPLSPSKKSKKTNDGRTTSPLASPSNNTTSSYSDDGSIRNNQTRRPAKRVMTRDPSGSNNNNGNNNNGNGSGGIGSSKSANEAAFGPMPTAQGGCCLSLLLSVIAKHPNKHLIIGGYAELILSMCSIEISQLCCAIAKMPTCVLPQEYQHRSGSSSNHHNDIQSQKHINLTVRKAVGKANKLASPLPPLFSGSQPEAGQQLGSTIGPTEEWAGIKVPLLFLARFLKHESEWHSDYISDKQRDEMTYAFRNILLAVAHLITGSSAVATYISQLGGADTVIRTGIEQLQQEFDQLSIEIVLNSLRHLEECRQEAREREVVKSKSRIVSLRKSEELGASRAAVTSSTITATATAATASAASLLLQQSHRKQQLSQSQPLTLLQSRSDAHHAASSTNSTVYSTSAKVTKKPDGGGGGGNGRSSSSSSLSNNNRDSSSSNLITVVVPLKPSTAGSNVESRRGSACHPFPLVSSNSEIELDPVEQRRISYRLKRESESYRNLSTDPLSSNYLFDRSAHYSISSTSHHIDIHAPAVVMASLAATTAPPGPFSQMTSSAISSRRNSRMLQDMTIGPPLSRQTSQSLFTLKSLDRGRSSRTFNLDEYEDSEVHEEAEQSVRNDRGELSAASSVTSMGYDREDDEREQEQYQEQEQEQEQEPQVRQIYTNTESPARRGLPEGYALSQELDLNRNFFQSLPSLPKIPRISADETILGFSTSLESREYSRLLEKGNNYFDGVAHEVVHRLKHGGGVFLNGKNTTPLEEIYNKSYGSKFVRMNIKRISTSMRMKRAQIAAAAAELKASRPVTAENLNCTQEALTAWARATVDAIGRVRRPNSSSRGRSSGAQSAQGRRSSQIDMMSPAEAMQLLGFHLDQPSEDGEVVRASTAMGGQIIDFGGQGGDNFSQPYGEDNVSVNSGSSSSSNGGRVPLRLDIAEDRFKTDRVIIVPATAITEAAAAQAADAVSITNSDEVNGIMSSLPRERVDGMRTNDNDNDDGRDDDKLGVFGSDSDSDDEDERNQNEQIEREDDDGEEEEEDRDMDLDEEQDFEQSHYQYQGEQDAVDTNPSSNDS